MQSRLLQNLSPFSWLFAEFTADIHSVIHRYTFFDSADARLFIDVTRFAGNYEACKDNFTVTIDENGMISGFAELQGAFHKRF